MSTRRVAKASQAIKEVVSSTILFGLRDPRIKNVTVIAAEAADDMRSAKVYISVRGDAKTEALTLKGLESAKGYLQSKIADRLQTRYTPILSFQLDQGVKQSIETSRILREDVDVDLDEEEGDIDTSYRSDEGDAELRDTEMTSEGEDP